MTKEAAAPTQRVGQRVVALREQRGLSQRALADRLTSLGVRTHQTGVAKIETGGRKVTVDDLVALAVALNVSPGWLLAPPDADDELVALVGSVSAPAWAVWQWVDGAYPLPTFPEGPDADVFNTPEEEQAFAQGRPPQLRQQEQHPAAQAAKQLYFRVKRVLHHVGKQKRKGDRGLETTLSFARRAVDRVSAELDDIEEEAHETPRGGRR